MVEPTAHHRERITHSLRKHAQPRTARQLIAAGGCWRAVMDMSAEGLLAPVGSNGRAAVTYALVRVSS